MAYNIFGVIKDLATGKLRIASQDVIKKRMEICNDCDAKDATLNTCTVCGCFLAAKQKLKKASCPMELW